MVVSSTVGAIVAAVLARGRQFNKLPVVLDCLSPWTSRCPHSPKHIESQRPKSKNVEFLANDLQHVYLDNLSVMRENSLISSGELFRMYQLVHELL